MGSMGVSMSFSTGGRDDETRLDEAARKKVAAYVERRVGGMVCPDHGKPPAVICEGDSLDALRFDVRGCCQKMVHLVRTKLEE